MKTLKKAAIGTVATGAMLMAAASPAQAQNRGDRYDRDRDGISAGEIIAGVVVLGGLAAILSSGDNDRYDNRGYDGRDYRGGDYGYDNGRYNGGYDYNRYGNSRQAINQCVNAVNQRSSYKRGARVDQVTRVERTGKGYKIEGRVSTNDRYGNDRYNNGRYNDGRYNDGRYDNRYGNDRYGYNNNYGNNYGRDTGTFSCTVKYGRVDKVKVRGV